MKVPVTQKYIDADDLAAMHAAVDEGHFTHGRHAAEFERGVAEVFGLRYGSFVNSGSSANLLALAALMDESLGEDRLKPGDEVVTCAAGFPTTVNPIVQLGMVPVFVDCELPGYGPNTEQLAEACQRENVRAVMVAHTLGNPIDLTRLTWAILPRKQWFVEDCCDALGSWYKDLSVGNYGHLATCSFYPAHHITTGEGGMVLTDSPKLNKIINSLRDWGRDCWCPTGKDNTCGKRFDHEWQNVSSLPKNQQVEAWGKPCLPDGYDHKHVFSRVGWNLKGTDISAALGVSQLKKREQFELARSNNFFALYAQLTDLDDRLILPQATLNSKPCWFGFPITLREPLDRRKVIGYLESVGVQTRPVFAGNLTRQPAYRNVKYEVVGDLACADRVMRQSFYVGIHPSLSEEQVAYLAKCIREAVTQ